jgi:C_GCAxxG_C_C family probable redox protein
MTHSTTTDTALARFSAGYNCSQSTFSALAEELGLSSDVALRIAAPFGGGIGRQGEVCGAASGALMALGLRFGSASEDKDAKERAYTVAAEFVRRFEERAGALRCRDLIHADMTTPEGLADARERKVFSSDCPRYVAAAMEIAEGMLRDAARDAQP